MGSGVSAQGGDLLGDEVEEGFAVFDFEEAFGFLEAHAGAESSVELEDDGLGKSLSIPLGVLAGNGEVVGDVGGCLEGFFAHEAFFASIEEGITAFKGSNGGFSETSGFHFFTERGEFTHRELG